jgi:hypothetical protein
MLVEPQGFKVSIVFADRYVLEPQELGSFPHPGACHVFPFGVVVIGAQVATQISAAVPDLGASEHGLLDSFIDVLLELNDEGIEIVFIDGKSFSYEVEQLVENFQPSVDSQELRLKVWVSSCAHRSILFVRNPLLVVVFKAHGRGPGPAPGHRTEGREPSFEDPRD